MLHERHGVSINGNWNVCPTDCSAYNKHIQASYYLPLLRIFHRCPMGCPHKGRALHYNDVIMSTIASEITSLTIVYSTIYSAADQRKHQSSASLAFVQGIHRGPVNSPHKWSVTWKMFPFDDVIMAGKFPCHDAIMGNSDLRYNGVEIIGLYNITLIAPKPMLYDLYEFRRRETRA